MYKILTAKDRKIYTESDSESSFKKRTSSVKICMVYDITSNNKQRRN